LPAQHLGLTDYLQGQAPMEAIIQPCEGYPNLFIISAGPTSAFASELLEQSAMDALISYLRKVYDDIVFDTPPVHLVTDALVLSRFSEVTLYVLRQGVTPASELGFIRELVRQQKLPNLNLIFNGVQVKGKYGYGYNNRLYSDYFAARNSNPNPAGSALGRVFRWFT
jgi:Mrp family chromosome partitioning ATPase